MNSSQNTYLKACIRDSLFTLLEHKAIDKISVTEIVTLAGVSRMSFYRHYQSKEEIIIAYIRDTFEQYIDTIKSHNDDSFELSSELFFTFFKNNHGNVLSLINNGLFHLFLPIFSEFLQTFNRTFSQSPNVDDQHLMFYYNYNAGGLLNLVHEWIKNGMHESEEQMSQILKSIYLSHNDLQ